MVLLKATPEKKMCNLVKVLSNVKKHQIVVNLSPYVNNVPNDAI